MFRFALPIIAALSIAASLPASAQTQTGTLQKIKDSRKITLGVRESSVPFAYNGDDNRPVGYAVDICRKVVDAVKAKLGLADLKIEFIPANSNNRIPLITNGTMDLECASTSNLVERQKVVAFSLTHFVSNITGLVRKDSAIRSFADLEGKTVSLIKGMTSLPVFQKYVAEKKLNVRTVYGKDVAEAFLLFQQGRADMFIFDDVLLASSAANSTTPGEFRMLADALRSEPNALMLRKDDEPFKALVDDTIRSLIKSGELEKLYTRWFTQPIPPRGINLNFPISKELREAFDSPNDKGV